MYPSAIFKKVKEYNTVVYVPEYPLLIEYINKTMKSAKDLFDMNRLYRVEILVTDGTRNKKLESHKIELMPACNELKTLDDEFLIKLETQMRNCLIEISDRLKPMPKLAKSTTFKILLHTTEQAYVKLANNPKYAKMPFIQQLQDPQDWDDFCEITTNKSSVIPITFLEAAQLQICAETYT